jgi:hypothetical protein
LVGLAALDPGQGAGLVLQFAVDALDRAFELDEPVALDRGEPGDRFRGLGDLLVDAVQRPPGPVGPVGVVDDLATALVLRPGGPGLGEDVPVGDLPAQVLPPQLADHLGDVGTFIPRMNDSLAASIAFMFASEIVPASATTVTSGRLRAAMNFSMTGSIVLVSALLPSKARTMSGNPSCPVSRPIVIWGSSRRSLENPDSRNPSPLPVLKYSVYADLLVMPMFGVLPQVTQPGRFLRSA